MTEVSHPSSALLLLAVLPTLRVRVSEQGSAAKDFFAKSKEGTELSAL